MTRINKCHLDEALVLRQVVFQDNEASAAARTGTRRDSAAAEPRTAISVEQNMSISRALGLVDSTTNVLRP